MSVLSHTMKFKRVVQLQKHCSHLHSANRYSPACEILKPYTYDYSKKELIECVRMSRSRARRQVTIVRISPYNCHYTHYRVQETDCSLKE
ncbi:hypothetical protein KIN20_010190 [Parelaphostrongylus tenuis]|uniref:Uncharacterized protein n=1 Tax=Parelaphostrongylus tenuis TaxID=148309 RepID=A0AAD5QLQ1_PARTN|nr:hypothetical protein KIN20_010190 [Parelaphostrongylus tenuis]